MYGIDLSVQFENLMPALGLGFILAFVYDVTVFLRSILFTGKAGMFLTDMIFVIFCTVSSLLLFFAVNSGHIRIYLVIAEILAAAVYRFTAGAVVSAVSEKIAAFIKNVILKIVSPFCFITGKVSCVVAKNKEKVRKLLKKFKINSKNPLKDNNNL